MATRREQLQAKLVEHYRCCGFEVGVATDGTVRAIGLGGVEWIGLVIVHEDVDSLADRLVELSRERMPTGQLCAVELLPDAECEQDVRDVLLRTGIRDWRYVEIYSLAA
jgi:hypothetical protein